MWLSFSAYCAISFLWSLWFLSILFCFRRVVPAEGHCSMYGICGQRSDGKVLNCVNATKAVKVMTQSLVDAC
jgi:hypothetical protein